jgi:hypothetical protein
VPDDRTTITELGTALGILPYRDPRTALARRPGELCVDDGIWDLLDSIASTPRWGSELRCAFANGKAFLAARDGLRGRSPLSIEWTGGRRPPGDEVAPIDLRVDHVYLISCKYESDILANASPARVFDGLLATSGDWGRDDWYEAVAPDELATLYRACVAATGMADLPPAPSLCTKQQLRSLRRALPGRAYPDADSRSAYAALCRAVSVASADRWRTRVDASGTSGETMLWRLLRIGSAPYFLLGVDRRNGSPARYRIAGPWDWRERYEVEEFTVTPGQAGQPRVDWTFRVADRRQRNPVTVGGHVEIRWSHGRFAQPPEAKVYLDTPMGHLPGYHLLESWEQAQPTLWSLSG